MKVSPSLFSGYDIRGVYGHDFDESVVARIVRAYVRLYKPYAIVLARDVRVSSPALHEVVKRQLERSGVEVFDIGIATTDMMYFAVGGRDVDGGIMITASHNPREYNGIKIVGRGVMPLGSKDLDQIYHEACREEGIDTSVREIVPGNVVEGEAERLLRFALTTFAPGLDVGGRVIVFNTNHGAAGAYASLVAQAIHATPVYVFEGFDGSFPQGKPDPLSLENREAMKNAITRSGAWCGIAWDADADRCFFFDEHGNIVLGAYTGALLAEYICAQYSGAALVTDPRATLLIEHIAQKNNAHLVVSQTGHPILKAAMREQKAILGIECSGHYYYQDFWNADSGLITALVGLRSVLGGGSTTFSDALADLRVQVSVGEEINILCDDRTLMLKKFQDYFPQAVEQCGGFTVRDKESRIHVRLSRTEPFLRYTVEAYSVGVREQKEALLLDILAPGRV